MKRMQYQNKHMILYPQYKLWFRFRSCSFPCNHWWKWVKSVWCYENWQPSPLMKLIAPTRNTRFLLNLTLGTWLTHDCHLEHVAPSPRQTCKKAPLPAQYTVFLAGCRVKGATCSSCAPDGSRVSVKCEVSSSARSVCSSLQQSTSWLLPPKSQLLSSSTLMLSYRLEPSKLESCWSAHPRCAGAVSQLVVERQYRQSVSCNVIAWADCLVTGGVSGHYNISITCSSLVFFTFYKFVLDSPSKFILIVYVGLSIESMHYMMSSTLYRVHWSKIHYTESRSPLSFDQLQPAAQSSIRRTLFLPVPYSQSRSPVLSSHAVLCVVPDKEQFIFSFACLVAAHSFLHFSHGCQFCCEVADSNLSRGNQGG